MGELLTNGVPAWWAILLFVAGLWMGFALNHDAELANRSTPATCDHCVLLDCHHVDGGAL